MSGSAVANGIEATIGLVPRYLRSKEAASPPSWASDDVDGTVPIADSLLRETAAIAAVRGPCPTDEMRRRIVDAAAPERRGSQRLWIGLAILAVFATAGLLFPDAIAAFLPDVDSSL